MDFLQLEQKRIAVFGVANKKSVAYRIGKMLTEAGLKSSTWCAARHDATS